MILVQIFANYENFLDVGNFFLETIVVPIFFDSFEPPLPGLTRQNFLRNINNKRTKQHCHRTHQPLTTNFIRIQWSPFVTHNRKCGIIFVFRKPCDWIGFALASTTGYRTLLLEYFGHLPRLPKSEKEAASSGQLVLFCLSSFCGSTLFFIIFFVASCCYISISSCSFVVLILITIRLS